MSKATTSRVQLLMSLGAIMCVIATGTLGYHFIEGWSLFDALYMTIITATTVGYREVHALSPAGQAFTMFILFFSVGAVFYALNNTMRFLIEGELRNTFGRRKLQKRVAALQGHYIVCGYGRMGRIICRELAAEGAQFVCIEKCMPEGGVPDDLALLVGDATKDETLKEAGIERASGLISVLPTDAENLYVVLSARGINPKLQIVARAVEENSEQKLVRAGANRVVSPYHIGGLRIAHTLLKPAVVDFIELTTQKGVLDLEIEEVAVRAASSLAGGTLGSSGIGRELNLIVVAVKKTDGAMRVNPTHKYVIEPDDVLVVIGEVGNLKILETLAAGAKGSLGPVGG